MVLSWHQGFMHLATVVGEAVSEPFCHLAAVNDWVQKCTLRYHQQQASLLYYIFSSCLGQVNTRLLYRFQSNSVVWVSFVSVKSGHLIPTPLNPNSLVRQLVPYSKLDYKSPVLLQSLGYHHKLKPCRPKSESPDKTLMAWTLFVTGLFVAQIFAPILTWTSGGGPPFSGGRAPLYAGLTCLKTVLKRFKTVLNGFKMGSKRFWSVSTTTNKLLRIYAAVPRPIFKTPDLAKPSWEF